MMAESYLRVARDLQKQLRHAHSALTSLLLKDGCARRLGRAPVAEDEIADAIRAHHRLTLQMAELGDEYFATRQMIGRQPVPRPQSRNGVAIRGALALCFALGLSSAEAAA